MVDAFKRYEWDGKPYLVGEMFVVKKNINGRPIDSVCRLVSHPLGWELRLDMAGVFQRSQVCRSQGEILDTSEEWKASMLEKGWS